jgi:hypothetical protein
VAGGTAPLRSRLGKSLETGERHSEPRAQMISALRGRFTDHFRWELKLRFERMDFVDRQAAE